MPNFSETSIPTYEAIGHVACHILCRVKCPMMHFAIRTASCNFTCGTIHMPNGVSVRATMPRNSKCYATVRYPLSGASAMP